MSQHVDHSRLQYPLDQLRLLYEIPSPNPDTLPILADPYQLASSTTRAPRSSCSKYPFYSVKQANITGSYNGHVIISRHRMPLFRYRADKACGRSPIMRRTNA